MGVGWSAAGLIVDHTGKLEPLSSDRIRDSFVVAAPFTYVTVLTFFLTSQLRIIKTS